MSHSAAADPLPSTRRRRVATRWKTRVIDRSRAGGKRKRDWKGKNQKQRRCKIEGGRRERGRERERGGGESLINKRDRLHDQLREQGQRLSRESRCNYGHRRWRFNDALDALGKIIIYKAIVYSRDSS